MTAKNRRPVSYDAYERLADAYGDRIEAKPHNAYLERPATSLYAAGFLVERLIDAKPTPDYRKADPEGYEIVSLRPSFLNIRAVPMP